ncbi:MAG: caspase family protein, partial [Caldilineaceae bacterium]|nr:caspase family protein [Caldilineaceae bacterium]
MNTDRRAVQLIRASTDGDDAYEFQRSLAIVIGINAYTNGIPQLRTARADAERLAQILADQHGYEVTLLVDAVSGERLTTLFSEELPQRVGPADRLLIYFAGHGIALDGDDGPTGYLIPQDANRADRNTFLPMQAIHDALASLPCRHCLIILDCCFAGAFRWASMRTLTAPAGPLYRERYERFLRSPAWQVLTSAAYDQEALDALVTVGFGAREVEGHAHSPFALALFDALTGAGATSSDANHDGVVVATELYLYLRDIVEERAKAEARHWQTPGLWPLRKHDKGEYIFLLGEPHLPPAPPLTADNNPYRGLASYNAEDADLFFGRQQLIQTLAALVKAKPLTVVVGASGTGKSSVVKAGVAPYLTGAAHRQPAQPGSTTNGAAPADPEPSPPNGPEHWYALQPLRPTETPLKAFAELLAAHLPGNATPAPSAAVEASIASAFSNWCTANPTTKLLLIVDQCEELVTLCHDETERFAFQALLQKLLTDHPTQLH